MLKAFIISGLFLLAGLVPVRTWAQARPLGFAAAGRPGLDRAFVALVMADAAAFAFDGWSTVSLSSRPGLYEFDPFLGRHPSAVRVGWTFAAIECARVGLLYELHRHGHPRAAKIILACSLGYDLAGDFHNLKLLRQGGF